MRLTNCPLTRAGITGWAMFGWILLTETGQLLIAASWPLCEDCELLSIGAALIDARRASTIPRSAAYRRFQSTVRTQMYLNWGSLFTCVEVVALHVLMCLTLIKLTKLSTCGSPTTRRLYCSKCLLTSCFNWRNWAQYSTHKISMRGTRQEVHYVFMLKTE